MPWSSTSTSTPLAWMSSENVFSWWGTLTLALAQVVLAVVFGVSGINRAKRGAPNKSLAVAGLVLGLVGLVIYFFVWAVLLRLGLAHLSRMTRVP